MSGEYWNFHYPFKDLPETASVDRVADIVFFTLIDKRIDKSADWPLPKLEFTPDPTLVERASKNAAIPEDYRPYGLRVNDRPYVVVHPANIYLANTPTAFTDVNLINPVNAYLHLMYVGTRRFLEEQSISVSKSLLDALTPTLPTRNDNELNSEFEGLSAQLTQLSDDIRSGALQRKNAVEATRLFRRFFERFGDAFATRLGQKAADGLAYLIGLLIVWAALLK